MARPRPYTVKLSRQARRMLLRLPSDLAAQLTRVLHGLGREPLPRGANKLTGYDLYRIRARDWRIVYQVRDRGLLVLVVKIASRGSAYDEL